MSRNINLKGYVSAFERIIINILINSIQALENRNNKKAIKIYDSIINNKYYLIIEDNGCGIEEKMLSSVFDAGFTTKNNSENLGLGLNFVKTILETKFHSKIQIKSKVNSGTIVTIEFNEYK
jgi:signal transduction histidine kinase